MSSFTKAGTSPIYFCGDVNKLFTKTEFILAKLFCLIKLFYIWEQNVKRITSIRLSYNILRFFGLKVTTEVVFKMSSNYLE